MVFLLHIQMGAAAPRFERAGLIRIPDLHAEPAEACGLISHGIELLGTRPTRQFVHPRRQPPARSGMGSLTAVRWRRFVGTGGGDELEVGAVCPSLQLGLREVRGGISIGRRPGKRND